MSRLPGRAAATSRGRRSSRSSSVPLQSVADSGQSDPFADQSTPASQAQPATRATLMEAGAAASLSSERRDLHCSVIGLTVKLGLVLMAGVSLVRLAGAYQERMDRQGELAAVLQLEQAKLAKARERFDTLFGVEGEQRLIREQNQWIAPNRLRVVWKPSPADSAPTP
jgi:hypothetical protein